MEDERGAALARLAKAVRSARQMSSATAMARRLVGSAGFLDRANRFAQRFRSQFPGGKGPFRDFGDSIEKWKEWLKARVRSHRLRRPYSRSLGRAWASRCGRVPIKGKAGSPAYEYQKKHCGDWEREVRGTGAAADVLLHADGIDAERGCLLDATHVGPPSESSYVPGSAKPPPGVTAQIIAEFRNQLRRYKAVLEDGTCPLMGVEIITNNKEAAANFRRLLREERVPGHVRIAPE